MWRAIAVAVLAGAAATGCTSDIPRLTNLEGRVNFNGKPLKAGYVQFTSADNVTSTGAELSAEGKYRVVGAPVGLTRIAVSAKQFRMLDANPDDPSTAGGNKPNPRYVAIPDKYADAETSGLEATIEPGQREYDIELASK